MDTSSRATHVLQTLLLAELPIALRYQKRIVLREKLSTAVKKLTKLTWWLEWNSMS
jgi:hypothetical protein